MAGIDDIKARLRTAIADGDRRLSFVLGAGVSTGVVPGVEPMIDYFVDELPRAERGAVRRAIQTHPSAVERYQEAAQLVLARGGARRVRTALCKATLDACTITSDRLSELLDQNLTPESLKELERSGNWRHSESHSRFADFYASIPARLRGRILTTNFDPLIEVNLNAAGVAAEPVSMAGNMAPTQEQLDEQTATPVLHLHGFWRHVNSLHTTSQLERIRPAVSNLVRQALSNSLVVVVGYGGWNDVFMRALVDAVMDGQLYDTEICWCVYSSDQHSISANSTLAQANGIPGFNFYFGIDAGKVFDLEMPALDINAEIGLNSTQASPDGFTIIKPPPIQQNEAPSLGNTHFVEGYEPDWLDAQAGAWPMLESTQELLSLVRDALDKKGGGVAAIGPMGEGKSLALRQVALALEQEQPRWTVMWREPGAPQMTSAWFQDAANRYGQLLVVIDNADLVIDELVGSQAAWSRDNSNVVILLSSHDRVWWNAARTLSNGVPNVLFHGITSQDAESIARSWIRIDLAPQAFAALTEEEQIVSTSRKLLASASGIEGNTETTLMGAVLATRSAAGLQRRVGDLLDKLEGEPASRKEAITMAHVFGAICLVQNELDPEGLKVEGISRSMLAAIVDTNGTFPDSRILTILGKEALISFAGERVYSRHSSIAREVLNILRARRQMDRVCYLVGRAAARLKTQGEVPRDSWYGPLHLGKKLQIESESLQLSEGVLFGAPKSLGARLDRVHILRRWNPSHALETAKKSLEHRQEFHDSDEVIRVFLNELARCAIACRQPALALGAASIGLGGSFKYPIEFGQMSYFLKSIYDSAVILRDQNASEVSNIPELAKALSGRVFSTSTYIDLSGANSTTVPQSISTLSSQQLASALQKALTKFAAPTAAECSLAQYYRNSLDFSGVLFTG